MGDVVDGWIITKGLGRYGTRYRYYVSTSGAAKNQSKGRRIPAANLETLVITKLRTFLADEGALLDAIRDKHDAAGQTRLIDGGP